jgi:hypothetical protein
VLRPYGGPVKSTFAGRRYGSASVQVDGRGADGAAVLERLYQVFDALHDDQERPRMHWEIAGKVLDADTNALADDPDGSWLVRHVRFLQAVPGLTGREQGRQFGTFNFDVGWDRVPAA